MAKQSATAPRQVRQHASIVRFGQVFFVVGDIDAPEGGAVTREQVEATAIARFAFTGPCKKSNPSASAALNQAKAYCYEVTHG